jgi:hypothetical protein
VSVNLAVTAAVFSVTPTELSFQISQGSSTQSQMLQIAGAAGTAWHAAASTTRGGA